MASRARLVLMGAGCRVDGELIQVITRPHLELSKISMASMGCMSQVTLVREQVIVKRMDRLEDIMVNVANTVPSFPSAPQIILSNLLRGPPSPTPPCAPPDPYTRQPRPYTLTPTPRPQTPKPLPNPNP